MSKKIRKRDVFKYLTVPVSLAMLWFYIYYTEGWERIVQVFKNLDYRYVVLLMLYPIVYHSLNAVCVAYMRRPYQRGVPFLYTLHTTFIANFWGSITPATMQIGMISQIAAERTQGLNVGNSTAIHFANSLPQTVALLLKKIVMFFIAFNYLRQHLNFFFWIFFLADCLMSIVNVCVYFILPRFDKIITKILDVIIKVGAKLHIVKKPVELTEKSQRQVLLLKSNMKSLKYTSKDWIVTILICLLIQVLDCCSLYLSINALHIKLIYPYLLTVAIQTVGAGIMSFLSFIPIPGQFGIMETISYVISKPLLGAENINFSIILGRLTTYYFPLLVYAIATAIPVRSGKHRLNMERNDDL